MKARAQVMDDVFRLVSPPNGIHLKFISDLVDDLEIKMTRNKMMNFKSKCIDFLGKERIIKWQIR